MYKCIRVSILPVSTIFQLDFGHVPTMSVNVVFSLYHRACGSYYNFFDQGLLLTRKLLNQGFLVVKLKSSRKKKCSSRYHDLFYEYQVCLCFYDISIRF